MSLIDIEKWNLLWEYVLRHIGAVVLGLVIGISIAVGLYQGILIPAKEAEIKAAIAAIDAKGAPSGTPTTPNTNPCLRKAIVVFVDGYGTYAGYRHEGEAISTAHFLVATARDDEGLKKTIDAKDAIIPQAGKIDPAQIIDMHPDVVVIHRSTFDAISQDPEERLRDLIRKLSSTSALFLVYSRTAFSDGLYSAQLAQSTGTEGRVYSFQFRPGHPFEEDANVIYFLRYINTLARGRLCDNLRPNG